LLNFFNLILAKGFEEMSLKKIFVICPIHRRADLISMQLVNYNNSTNNGCKHVLHVSKDGRNNFTQDDYASFENYGAVLTNESYGTSWKCAIGGIIACTKLLDVLEYDFVYVHTDADLLIKGNLQDYIYEKRIGYSCHDLSYGVDWAHYDKLINDRRFADLRESLGLSINDVYFGRQEGAFYPSVLWLKIITKISEFYDDVFFNDLDAHWPIEESVVPTLAKYYSTETRSCQNVVHTKEWSFDGGRENPQNCVSVSDLLLKYNDNTLKCVGVKWFSQDINDEARCMVVRNVLGEYV
jgi:hypothetical protein